MVNYLCKEAAVVKEDRFYQLQAQERRDGLDALQPVGNFTGRQKAEVLRKK